MNDLTKILAQNFKLNWYKKTKIEMCTKDMQVIKKCSNPHCLKILTFPNISWLYFNIGIVFFSAFKQLY